MVRERPTATNGKAAVVRWKMVIVEGWKGAGEHAGTPEMEIRPQ